MLTQLLFATLLTATPIPKHSIHCKAIVTVVGASSKPIGRKFTAVGNSKDVCGSMTTAYHLKKGANGKLHGKIKGTLYQ